MATEVLMPKLGLTMTEGTIEEWKYKEGDAVKKGDILFSVATDKLTNDVECEEDGTLLKILLPEGETAPCKSVIAWIGQPGEAIPDASGAAAPAAAAPAAAPSAASAAAPAAAPTAHADRPAGAYVLATPYAKKLAKEKGYDLSQIPGTGPNGTVVAKDVENFVAGPKTSPMAAKLAAELGVDVSKLDVQGRVMKADVLAAAGVGAAAAPAAEAAAAVEGNDEKPVKVNPLRRSIAANMTNSWHTSPRVTYTRPVEVTAMKDLRAKLKDGLKEQGIKLTYNHILMKVVAKALTEFPDVNASFADNMLTRHKHVNMGLAVAKGDGITSFSPIINQPELAILGVCDMVDTPVVRNGEIVIRTMMNLSLTADHRVIDGVMASKFLKRIAELLENPYMLLV